MRNGLGVLIAFVAGILCLAANQVIFSPAFPSVGEYYWIHLAVQNYTVFSCVLMSVSGFLVIFGMGGNPFLIGWGTVAIFPVIAFVEATVYRGSHNLIPFELMVYVLYSGPAIGGALLGWLIRKYGLTVRRE